MARAIPRFFAGKSSINRTFIVALASACIAAWFLTGERGRDLFPEVSACLTNPWISEAVDVYAPAVFVIAVLCLILITFVRIESGVFEAGKLAAAACVVWVLWGAVTHPADLLVTSQRQAAWETIGDPGVNMKLREMLGGKHINMPIVTDYWFLRSLPDMRDLFRRTTCGGPCTVNVLHADMRTYSDAGFILLGEGNLAPETREAFDRGSEFTTLFLVNGYRFVQINRNAGPLAQQH